MRRAPVTGTLGRTLLLRQIFAIRIHLRPANVQSTVLRLLVAVMLGTSTAGYSGKTLARFSVVSENCTVRSGCYQITGEIGDDDATKVQALVQDLRKRDMATPMFFLNSVGGSVQASLRIGRELRKVKAIAVVDREHSCLSACVFVLGGATQRVVTGKVGIHRPYSPSARNLTFEETQREYTSLPRAAKGFLSEMNLPEDLFEAMVRVPPETIRILNVAELSSYGLSRPDPVWQEVMDANYARQYGISKQTYLQRKALAEQMCSQFRKSGNSAAYSECDERVLRTGQ